MNEYFKPYTYDSDIRELLIDLNSRGFETEGSCAGHIGYGFIDFDGKLSKDEVKELKEVASIYKLTNAKFRGLKTSHPSMIFDSVVSSKGSRDFWGESYIGTLKELSED